MARIEQDHAAALLEHVAEADPELLPACRWLVLGRRLAPRILGQVGRAPATGELVRLLHLVDSQAPEVKALARSMIAASGQGAEAEIEFGLDRLAAAPEARWTHPTQVLSRPCPDFRALLAGCASRLVAAKGDQRAKLQSVKRKLERAVSIDARASRRRGLGS